VNRTLRGYAETESLQAASQSGLRANRADKNPGAQCDCLFLVEVLSPDGANSSQNEAQKTLSIAKENRLCRLAKCGELRSDFGDSAQHGWLLI
jgi:hypothetical protein